MRSGASNGRAAPHKCASERYTPILSTINSTDSSPLRQPIKDPSLSRRSSWPRRLPPTEHGPILYSNALHKLFAEFQGRDSRSFVAELQSYYADAIRCASYSQPAAICSREPLIVCDNHDSSITEIYHSKFLGLYTHLPSSRQFLMAP